MSGPKNAIADKKPAAGAPPVMPDGRVEFEDGEWALLETRPTHGEFKKLFKFYVGLAGAPILNSLDESTEIVSTLLREWNVKDREGHELGTDPESIDRCPSPKLMAILTRCSEIFKAIPAPKA